jgi:predicted RNA-binding Zn-ribbon protein involved in translation (DUF1610 family)
MWACVHKLSREEFATSDWNPDEAPKINYATGIPMSPSNSAKSCYCPHCGSNRLHRSHRRGAIERFLSVFGAQVRRCHSCKARQAWFATPWFAPVALRLGDDASQRRRWSGAALLGGGFAACLGLLWWMISRLTQLSG